MDNKRLYKFSENGIKKRNLELWRAVTNQIKEEIPFKEKFFLYENKINYPKCYCGNSVKFIDMKKGFREFCSKKCMYNSKSIKEKRKETSIKKYGVDNPSKSREVKKKVKKTNNKKFGNDWATQNESIKEKFKKTNLERYGVDNPSKIKEVREKAKKTMLERYGVEHAMLSDKIKKNLKKFYYNKYGVDNPSKVKEVREKAKKTMLYRYGVEYALQNKYFLSKLKKTNLKKYGEKSYTLTNKYKKDIKKTINEKNKLIVNNSRYNLLESTRSEYVIFCNKCNSKFKIQRQLYRNRLTNKEEVCVICNKVNKSSSISEKKVLDYIKKIYDGKILENYRIDKKEIDIYLPDLKIGFEYNGLYWHSELNKNKNYHIDKIKFFSDKGIKLIQIWEDDWNLNKKIIKSIISNKLLKSKRIFARKCKIKEVTDNKLIRSFLNKNHIQGFVGSKVKIGLFYKGELVSLMTFGSLRRSLGQKNKIGSYELLRFCNKLNTSVVGGGSKLFKYFKLNFEFSDIISYSLNSYSDGNLYKKLGFRTDNKTKLNYFWCKNGIRNNRFKFRKDVLVKEGFDKSKTEKDIMYDKGYFRVFGCGTKKWIYHQNLT